MVQYPFSHSTAPIKRRRAIAVPIIECVTRLCPHFETIAETGARILLGNGGGAKGQVREGHHEVVNNHRLT
jgi:hypothetical protein